MQDLQTYVPKYDPNQTTFAYLNSYDYDYDYDSQYRTKYIVVGNRCRHPAFGFITVNKIPGSMFYSLNNVHGLYCYCKRHISDSDQILRKNSSIIHSYFILSRFGFTPPLLLYPFTVRIHTSSKEANSYNTTTNTNTSSQATHVAVVS
jgi:hypothetical protein